MIELEKPEIAEDWLAAIAVAMVLTAAVAIPIVGIVMFWLLDTPTWSLVTAVAVIAACFLLLVLLPENDEEAEDETTESDEKSRWVVVRPEGAKGWAKHVGSILLGWTGASILINNLILDQVFGVGVTTNAIVAIALLLVAILVETFDLEEVERSEDGSAALPSAANSP